MNYHKFIINFSFKDVVVSIGPLTLGQDVIEIYAGRDPIEEEFVETIIEEAQEVALPEYFIYVLLGCLVLVVGLLAAIIVLTYKRKKSQKVIL